MTHGLPAPTAIGFDADDTLWQNEHFFRLTEARFASLLADHADSDVLSARLLEAEGRNLQVYGFGIKGFVLSTIETAIEVTDGRVPASVIDDILTAGRDMLSHPVETLPHAEEALEGLAGRYRIILITKGDLFDQERKLAQSGLGDYFDAVEIVSDKTATTYERVFARHADGPQKSMMVGNSLRSDVVPAIEAGGWGIHVPHHLTWVLEHAAAAQPPLSPPDASGRTTRLPRDVRLTRDKNPCGELVGYLPVRQPTDGRRRFFLDHRQEVSKEPHLGA